MALIGSAARAALLALVCPHCGEAQARARKPAGTLYACRRCHKRFSREQGLEAGARTRR